MLPIIINNITICIFTIATVIAYFSTRQNKKNSVNQNDRNIDLKQSELSQVIKKKEKKKTRRHTGH